MNQIEKDHSVWESKVKEAIENFSILQNELENSIACISDKMDSLEMQVIELNKTLELMNQTSDINLSLFSPYENTYRISESKRLQSELQVLCDKLPQLQQEFTILQSKKDKYNLIRECLEYLQVILAEDPLNVKSEKNSTILEKEKLGNNLTGYGTDCNGMKILETQEIERQRIARDLHDSTIQNLTNLVHKTELCLKLIDVDAIRAKLELAAMIESVRLIINNMREIIYNLRPMSIQDLGLVSTIELFIEKFMQQTHIQVMLNCQEENRNILPVINLSIYRIIQEACNNISKYANATICKITINYSTSHIELVIEDNGKGIDNKDKENVDCENNGFGISIMKERALLLSGNFSIETGQGKGTKIIVVIPYHEQKGD